MPQRANDVTCPTISTSSILPLLHPSLVPYDLSRSSGPVPNLTLKNYFSNVAQNTRFVPVFSPNRNLLLFGSYETQFVTSPVPGVRTMYTLQDIRSAGDPVFDPRCLSSAKFILFQEICGVGGGQLWAEDVLTCWVWVFSRCRRIRTCFLDG
jgi:hypothetical protein